MPVQAKYIAPNTLQINKAINILASKGYELVSQSGGDYISMYVIAFCTKILNKEPIITSEINGAFDSLHQNYKTVKWIVNNQFYLSIQTYIDDSVDNNIKNTMILRIRKI